MTYLIALGIYFALFAAALYISGRRFGLPTLGLTTGAVLSWLWAEDVAPQVAQAGLVVEKPPLLSLVVIALTVLPAVLVALKTPRSDGGVIKIAGALLFAVAAVLLTYPAFSSGVVLDAASQPIVKMLESYQAFSLTVVLVLALLEVVLKPHAHHKSNKR